MRTLSWEMKLLVLFTGISMIPLMAGLWSSSPAAGPTREESVDTHIPRGFVLIPVDVRNYEAVDSILGRFGIVDLFPSGEDGRVRRPIAVNVRMLRAPRNPAHFAVLVPETQADKILSHGGSYVVAVKRPDQVGTQFVNSESKARRRIVYEGD